MRLDGSACAGVGGVRPLACGGWRGGPQQAASILARARKVKTCGGLHAPLDDCCIVMLMRTAYLLLAHVLLAS